MKCVSASGGNDGHGPKDQSDNEKFKNFLKVYCRFAVLVLLDHLL